jgi:hypothetical protein
LECGEVAVELFVGIDDAFELGVVASDIYIYHLFWGRIAYLEFIDKVEYHICIVDMLLGVFTEYIVIVPLLEHTHIYFIIYLEML